jgi:hypothetical protein
MAELFGGFVQASQSLQRQAEIAERFGVLRAQAQSHAATSDGAIELAPGAIRLGEIGVKGRDAGPQRDGPADKFDGPAMIALLMAQNAEQMQSVRILFLASQHLPVQAVGRGKLPRLMHFNCSCQSILHGESISWALAQGMIGAATER